MRTHHGPTLIERLAPMVRQTLVHARSMAMEGELDRADSILREIITREAGSRSDLDIIAIAMLRAELLHLDGRDQAAREQFDILIRPKLDRLDTTTRLIVEQNFIDLRIARFGPETSSAVLDFYHLYDWRQAAQIEQDDNFNLAVVVEAIEKNDHRKALSTLWYESVRTYKMGCWGNHRLAIRRLGEEWLRIGEPADAVYCAILARDDVLARNVGDELLIRKDPALIRHVVSKMLLISNLRMHFCTACELLTRIGDAVEDDQLGIVAEWLLPRCSIDEDHQGTDGPVHRAWKALQSIAHRLPTGLVRRAVHAAVIHPFWTDIPSNMSWVARGQIVETLNRLVLPLPTEDLEKLARQVIPLAIERKQDFDYLKVIALLCHVAERGGEELCNLIGNCLFGPGQPRYHILGQVAHVFHQEYLSAERLNELPAQVTRNIRLQVQRRPRGQTFEVVPGAIFDITRETEHETVKTSIVNMMDWHAAARYRDKIPLESIQTMILAAVELLVDPENEMSNRASIIKGLIDVSPILDEAMTSRIFEAIKSIANGEIAGPPEQTSDPLATIKFTSISRADLRGLALFGIAQVGKRFPDKYRVILENLLQEAVCDPQVEVRRGAFAAFSTFPGQSEGTLLAVLLGTRDPDPGGANAAFAALADKPDLTLSRNHWRLLLYSIRLASQSTNGNLRRRAATVLARLINHTPGGALRTQAEEILSYFHSDICASVREASRPSTQESKL